MRSEVLRRAQEEMRQRMKAPNSIHDVDPQPSSSTPSSTCFEQHFTPQQLAAFWGWNPRRVQELFRYRDDVLIVKNEGKGKRRYTTISIPKSTAERVYASLRNKLLFSRLGNNSLQSPTPRPNPLGVMPLRHGDRLVPKKTRNIIKLNAVSQHPNSKSVT